MLPDSELLTGGPVLGAILLVDDEPSLLRVTARIIHRLGYSTLEAGSGDEAVRIAGGVGEPLAMMVTDVVMAGMDGMEAAEEVLKIQGEIPVLFVSGHDLEALVRRHGLSPSADFLQKPFTPAQLSSKLREMLSRVEPALVKE
mgnify:FL=1